LVATKKELTNKRLTRIKEMLAENPYLTLQELGDEFGITRQAMNQFLQRNKIQKARGNDRLRHTHCSEGHEFPAARRKRHVVQRCFICEPLPHTKYLNEDGLILPAQVSRPCSHCGKAITRSVTYAERSDNDSRYTGNWYCDRECFSKYQNEIQWWISSPVIQAHLSRKDEK